MSGYEFKLTDNSRMFISAKDEDIEKALTKIGQMAEAYAKLNLENDPRRIDTGRLRNSITNRVADATMQVATNVEYGP